MPAVLCTCVFLLFGVGQARIEFPQAIGTARKMLEIDFQELPFPQSDIQHQVVSATQAHVDGTKYILEYKPLLRSGDKSGEGTFGLFVDEDGNGLTQKDEPYSTVTNVGDPFISYGVDFNSLIPKDDYVCMLTHFKGPHPSAIYLTTLEQDSCSGGLTPKSTMPMDWSEWGGVWTPCAGSVTPWKTHLGSEGYEPDAREIEDFAKANATGVDWLNVRLAQHGLYYQNIPPTTTNAEALELLKPYMLGYPWEVKPMATEGGCAIESQAKHMAAGRLAMELAYVMPDQKTVYITDGGTNTMLAMFIASTTGDLSCGTLYASKLTQIDAANGGTFTVEWIRVGKEACTDDFREKAKTIKFYDMFETEEMAEDGTCPTPTTPDGLPKTFIAVNCAPNAGGECLRVVPGMEDYVARFEFRRFAAMKGATTEWSKMGGLTYDFTRSKLYVAMNEVREGMEDSANEGEPDPSYDIGGPNDIRVAWNECGCVYQMDVDGEYRVTKISALLCGDKDSNTDKFNACNKESISQPGNLAYVPGHDGLIIGEDTDTHQNDAVWYHDFATGSTTRILSTPYGSATTSVYWYPNINGWAYMMANVQHPYGESDEEKVDEALSTGLAAWTGYVGPFKARQDSVDMATAAEERGVSEPETLWNGWPLPKVV